MKGFLSGNAIKILAAVLMVVDHIGYFLFPSVLPLRIIGRIAFPLFAYLIAEGCRYTKDKWRHFALLFGLAVICQAVYYLVDGSLDMSVLVTFSLSTLLIYSLQRTKLCAAQGSPSQTATATLLFFSVAAATYFLSTQYYVDYGFWGCILPVTASLFDFRNIPVSPKLRALDCHFAKLACFAVGIALLPLCSEFGATEFYALIALVPLLFYNGQRGKLKTKYFFYLFYPLHLALLQGIAWLL